VHEVHSTGAGETAKKERLCVYEGEWPETLVLDSATDACRLLVEEIRRESPPTRGKDGLPIDSQRFWNVLIQRTQSMVLSIRDLPVHALFLALADDREKGDDDNKVRSITPKMATRDLSTVLAAAVNVVGYTYRRTKRGAGRDQNEVVYGIMTTGPEYMTTKPYRPLRDQEVPDFTYWIRVIRGEQGETLAAPLPSQEVGGGELGAEDKALNEPEPTTAAPANEETPAPVVEPAAQQTAAPKARAKKRRAG
jgi:hypothetical protein